MLADELLGLCPAKPLSPIEGLGLTPIKRLAELASFAEEGNVRQAPHRIQLSSST